MLPNSVAVFNKSSRLVISSVTFRAVSSKAAFELFWLTSNRCLKYLGRSENYNRNFCIIGLSSGNFSLGGFKTQSSNSYFENAPEVDHMKLFLNNRPTLSKLDRFIKITLVSATLRWSILQERGNKIAPKFLYCIN